MPLLLRNRSRPGRGVGSGSSQSRGVTEAVASSRFVSSPPACSVASASGQQTRVPQRKHESTSDPRMHAEQRRRDALADSRYARRVSHRVGPVADSRRAAGWRRTGEEMPRCGRVTQSGDDSCARGGRRRLGCNELCSGSGRWVARWATTSGEARPRGLGGELWDGARECDRARDARSAPARGRQRGRCGCAVVRLAAPKKPGGFLVSRCLR